MKISDDRRKDGDIEPENLQIRKKLFNEYEGGELVLDEDILSNKDTEVKTLSWVQFSSTGNLFVEYEALYPERKNFIESGIKTTKSKYWLFNFRDENGWLNDVVYIFSIKHLLKTIKKGLDEGWVTSTTTEKLPTGDYNKGYLVPLMMLQQEMYNTTHDNILVLLNESRERFKAEKKVNDQKRINELLKNRNR